MEVSSVQQLCEHLISCAIQRCRMSDHLCRLSVLLKSSPSSDPPLVRISGNNLSLSPYLSIYEVDVACPKFSDTGVGSCLEEFQCLKYAVDPASAEKWDITDDEIYQYHLNLKENVPTRRLTKLPSSSKNSATFRHATCYNSSFGTEMNLSIFGSVDALLMKLTHFLGKTVILKIPGPSDISWVMAVEFLPGLIGLADKSSDIKWKYHFESHSQTFLCIPSAKLNVVIELAVECGDIPGSRCEKIVPANKCSVLSSAASNIERLKSGLKEYVFKHGNSSSDICHSCFSDGVHLKVGSGVACCTQSHRNSGQVMEAVIIINEESNPTTSSCFRACDAKTEVGNLELYSEQALVYIAHPNDMVWKYLRLAIDLKHKNQSDKTIVLYFKDFSPCSISQSALNGLTSIDWKNYGLSLRSIADQDGYIFLEWENLPANTHIDLVLHCYHKEYPLHICYRFFSIIF
ncbi:hypothetical protein RHGRI_033461 [Rhododendron griersonianum]|uniref:Uncharacterized protein n=1 Tax=Rhododendron griersonianum TaxID=479676 RepID=A0AAV6HXB0_9ERIC|nr:hypothetical protein RHGRI_033461 [Rhododendron griersonianum]KAG5520908.1 hypothetical protein RHGRI_033461 [Rhododendron griersonianum]